MTGVYGIPPPDVCDCPLIDGEHCEDECWQLYRAAAVQLLIDAAEVENR